MEDQYGEPLAVWDDTLTQTEHIKADDGVNGVLRLGDYDGLNTKALLTAILITSRLIFTDRTYISDMTAMQLLEDDPRLSRALEEAWKNQEYRAIRNLAILFSLNPPRIPPVKASSHLHHTISKGVTSAFHREYRGSNHKLLLAAINSMDRTQDYSNAVSILQSSGHGKSRMVHEQAALVFTLPFNLRLSQDTKFAAYPLPDAQVAKHLRTKSQTKEDARCRFSLFFAALFHLVSDELHKLGQFETKGQLAAAWRKHLDDRSRRARSDLYDKVVRRALAELKPSSAETDPNERVNDADTKADKALEALLKQLAGKIDDSGPAPKKAKITSHGGPSTSINPSKDKGLQASDQDPIEIMLYFDEAHVLISQAESDVDVEADNHDALCGSMNALRRSPVFAIFLSTTSSMSILAPPISLARSARARAGLLQAPFTQTPFDCSPRFPLQSNALKLSEISKVEFLAQFGRPLFWTLLEADPHAAKEIFKLAQCKILNESDLAKPAEDYSSEALTALVDILVMLDFEPRRSHNFEVELVASHMRTAYSVPQHRAYLRSGYSSEPILAEAAARQIHSFHQQGRSDVMVTVLRKRFEEGLIAPGERGEVLMRVLLMEAYMRAVREEQKENSPVNFSEGCSLVAFLEELCEEGCATQVLGSYPDNIAGGKLEESALKNARVRFTHFAKAEDETVLGTTALLAAFVRGMAFVGWQSQKEIDFAIVILIDPTKPLHPANISVLLIQVKRRKTAGSKSKYSIDQQRLNVFPDTVDDEEPTRPYLTLVAELGVATKHRVEVTETSLPSREKRATVAQDVDTHPRYSISAYGCTGAVYKEINNANESVYAAILAMNPLFKEHPRQSKQDLQALRAQKPTWTTEGCIVDWFGVPAGKMVDLMDYEA